MLLVGDAAPDFMLLDADGNKVRLSKFSGSAVVLYFYPKDHTPGCTLEAKRFRDEYEEIAKHGAVVMGVSLDDSESHCAFRDKHELPFHLLADTDGRIHDLYEAWRTTMFGKTALAVKRCTYLIDDDGIIRKVYTPASFGGNHAKHVVADLEKMAKARPWGKKGAKLRDLEP